ncbi:DegV family protein [Candidatus Formimonas warabiya]|uniref:Fatty acid-binding protein DegV n=1 Tax=Formimonas warabiya TaxID=1761012 RepID=A0A3G1KXR7_FORW1|nr:DegV family protein [Candidatus Formimonas warabiya]ATW27274.1 fatty acid-binding protein DegV [Candidatus Formimonas warabiya]
MAEKIALVTDSTGDLSKEYVEENNIHVLPLKVVYRDKEYLDRVDIQPDQVYERLDQEIPSTSMPSVGEVIDLFSRLIKEGYKEILSINISSGLSGTFNTVRLAASHFPGVKIEVLDSKSISMGIGLLVQEAASFIKNGGNLTGAVERMHQIRDNLKVIFVVKTLEYLKRGGRIGYVSAAMGCLLDLKPVIAVNQEGKYFTLAKVRGRKKSLEKIVEIVKEAAEKNRLRLVVMHGDAKEEAKCLFEELKKITRISEIRFGEVGPVIGVHTGPGVVGVAFYPE